MKTLDTIKKIFHEAVEKQTQKERETYLDKVCRDNPSLRAEIDTLLEAHYGQDDLLSGPILGQPASPLEFPISESPGTIIDKYKLLEKIGEGGMAVVYMAEQEKPIRRKVALKIIKLGMDTKSVIARFEAERQALAMMDHPNIAKVLDAGATETGRPYFVMELVTGVSITEFCDKNNLSTKERLTLFIEVCNAVQHAHQKGIIHRDIKPTNVMVTLRDGQPVPKVIDFGIAKAINQKLTEKTLFTRYAHIIGTPAYMSPEQAELSDMDVDTRSDIYSLGVLLYELLTGTTPFSEEELRKVGYLEMQRVIREEEPTKPSTKLSTLGSTLTDIAQHRRSTPDLLKKAIRGDLDWIVLKTLEKNRKHRYDTANSLVLDVHRHLDNEPVQARAPKAVYRLQKFILRHKLQIIIVLTIAVLITATAITFSAWNRGRHELSIAKSLMDNNILSQAQESFIKGDYAAALDSIKSIVDSRHLGFKVQLLTANILVEVGQPDEAKTILEDLLDENPETAGAAHLLLARILLETGISDDEKFEKIGEHRQKANELLSETAEAYFLQAMIAIPIGEKLVLLNRALQLDPGHYESRRLRAYTYYASRKYEQMKEDALVMTALQPVDPLGYSLCAFALRELGFYEEAIADYYNAIKYTPREDSQLTKLYDQRCEMYLRMGKYELAIADAQEGLKFFPDATILHFRIFCALTAIGDYDKASALFHQITDTDMDSKREFRDWSKKHVFDTLEAGRLWHQPDLEPKGAAFVSMLEAVDIYHNLTAKGARRITTDGYNSEWSPDRSKLAFSMGVHGYSGLAVFDTVSQETELFMVPGAGPRWSPDGRYIAFVRYCRTLRLSELTTVERRRQNPPNVDTEVWIIRDDGTEPRRIAEGGYPSWSQDSKRVYYRSEGMFYSISIEDEEALAQPFFAFPGYVPSLSPDKKKLAYARPGWLKVVDTDSQSLIAYWTGPLRIWGVRWSSKSNQFSLGGFRNPEERTGLWIYDLNTNEALKVLSGHIINATWAPDETALAFCLGPPFYEIWSVDLDPNLSTIESLGSGRTLQQHHQEMVSLYTGRIDADPDDAESYLHRSMYYHYLNDKERYLADIRKYTDICLPSRELNSSNSWLKNFLNGIWQSTPTNLTTLNSTSNDGDPSISADGLTVYFCSSREGGFGKTDLYISRRATTSDPWEEPKNLGSIINSSMVEFEPEISSDGLTLFFVSDRTGGSGSYDIWFTKRATTDDPWETPVNLGPTINSSDSDGGPSLSADGLTLYFNSRRSDGQGGIDIFETTRPAIDAPWNKPVNLGPRVNSSLAEFYPFISDDGLSLFFVSMRWGGLGQGDLFVTTRQTIDDPWSTPVNLGPNVNTHNCDEYPEISSDGKYLIFSSNRSGGLGGYDLWQMEIPTMSSGSSVNDKNINQDTNE